ncbi:LysR family transcriptional regulator [Microbulbifer sp. 2304DJ12-6]|uniref:LysR family transcriptional regulator n=1 Tax=Microbulbifer sp. 2304DJ12-6 TaxID=3233340 RepID=UPI0039AF92DD
MNGSTYNQLKFFITIANEGGIRGAARKLEVAPPSVSQSLKQLEQHLGLLLFNRSSRHMELTEAGRMLFEQSQPMIEALAYTLESVGDLSNKPSGKVRLTVPRLTYELLIKPIYIEFCQAYPLIQLELSISDAAINLIEEGFDAGIRMEHQLEEGMVSLPLSPPMEEALFVSEEYIERFGLPASPEDLLHHRLIQYRFTTSNELAPLILFDKGKQIEVKMPSVMITNDSHLVIDAAEKGLGIGRVFAPWVKEQFADGRLKPILKGYWHSYPGLHLYFPPGSQKAKRIRVLIDFLRARAVRKWPS